jgi:hypothetical protein
LMYDCGYAVYKSATTNHTVGEHLTLHRVGNLLPGSDATYLLLKNSLLISVSNASSVFTGGSDVKVAASDTGIFTSVGGAAHYLSDDTYRSPGATTTNINPSLAAALKRRTTYPPVVLSSPISVSTNFGFLAKRDDDGNFDGGYHYDALDMVAYQVDVTNATVRLLPGVVLGVYGASGTYGLRLIEGAVLSGQGVPTNFVQVTRYNMVQEQSVTNWSASSVGPAWPITCPPRTRSPVFASPSFAHQPAARSM